MPAGVRDAFWSHPRRVGIGPLRPTQGPHGDDPSATNRTHRLELLLSINKRLNSSLDRSEVLELAMTREPSPAPIGPGTGWWCRPAAELSGAALRKLTRFDWPGNVRQLEHVITKAVALSEGDRIQAGDIDLPKALATAAPSLSRVAFERDEIERIAEALAEHRWNVSKVARSLSIPRATLYRRLKRQGLIQRRPVKTA